MINIEIFLDYNFYLEKANNKYYSFYSSTELKNIEIMKLINENLYPIETIISNCNFEKIESTKKIHFTTFNVEYLIQNTSFQKSKYYNQYILNELEKKPYLIRTMPNKVKTYSFCEKAILKDPYQISWINKEMENYFSLVKTAFLKDNGILRLLQIPKEYREQLKKEYNIKD